MFVQKDIRGARNGEGGVGAGDHSDHDREGEILEGRASQQIKYKDDQKDGERGDDCSRQGFVDSLIDHFFNGFRCDHPGMLADSVKNNNGVVDRITDNGQYRRQNRQVEFFVKDGKEAQHDDYVVKEGQNRPPGKLEIESETDIDQHADERKKDRHRPFAAQFLPNLGADNFFVFEGQSFSPETFRQFGRNQGGKGGRGFTGLWHFDDNPAVGFSSETDHGDIPQIEGG